MYKKQNHMKKNKITISCLILLILFNISIFSNSYAANVIWLSDPKTKDIFEHGLEDMKDKLDSNSKTSKRMLWSVMNINLDKNELYFDDKSFKIFVEVEGRTLLKYNTPKACRTLIKKAKRLLFGTATKERLMNYFPTIAFDDLRYFVQFKAKVDSWAIIDSNGKINDINPDEDIEDIPEEATNNKTISCSNNVMSKKIFYDTKAIK